MILNIKKKLNKKNFLTGMTNIAGTINFEIEGGNKLSGTVVTKTSKNGAMGIIPAALMNKGKTILKNVFYH